MLKLISGQMDRASAIELIDLGMISPWFKLKNIKLISTALLLMYSVHSTHL